MYVNAFKKGGWQDSLTFLDAKKFWEARGLVLPSPADWAQETGSEDPEELTARIEEIEKKLKQPVVSV